MGEQMKNCMLFEDWFSKEDCSHIITESNKLLDIQNATTAEEALAAIAVYERWSYPTQLFYDYGGVSYKEPHRVITEEILNKQSQDNSLQQRIGFLDRLRNEMINAQGATKKEEDNTENNILYQLPIFNIEALPDATNVVNQEIQIFDPTDNFNFD